MSSIDLKEHIICLRPEVDFIEFDAVAPARFSVEYLKPDDFSLARYLEKTRALIIPAVGPKISNEIFKNSNIEMVQVTGAGIDRLDSEYCRFNKIAVCNVQGVSAFAVAEYCIASAITIQFSFRSSCIFFLFTFSFFKPLINDSKLKIECEIGTPAFLRTVLSVKSL